MLEIYYFTSLSSSEMISFLCESSILTSSKNAIDYSDTCYTYYLSSKIGLIILKLLLTSILIFSIDFYIKSILLMLSSAPSPSCTPQASKSLKNVTPDSLNLSPSTFICAGPYDLQVYIYSIWMLVSRLCGFLTNVSSISFKSSETNCSYNDPITY